MNILGLIITVLLLSACAQTVRITANTSSDDTPLTEGINAKVLIQVPPDAAQQLHVESALMAVGLINDWKIDAHSNLPQAVGELFTQHYDKVDLAKSHHSTCNDCSLIVRPRITHLNINKISMQSSVTLELSIYDTQGQLVTTLSSTGKSPFLSAERLGAGIAGYFIPFFGNVIGSQVVATTVQRALDNALADIGTQIEYEANSGLLARTWLPSNLVKKQQYGQYEYTAEKVARNNGCDLRTDGIQLTEKKYFKENYNAYCWGKPMFTISCEYGRCSTDEKDNKLAAIKGD